MTMSDEYKRGWYDGYQAATDRNKYIGSGAGNCNNGGFVGGGGGSTNFEKKCKVCDIEFINSMGRLIPLGYSCPSAFCPSKPIS